MCGSPPKNQWIQGVSLNTACWSRRANLKARGPAIMTYRVVVCSLHKALNLALVKIDNRHVVLFVLIAQGFPNCLISLA